MAGRTVFTGLLTGLTIATAAVGVMLAPRLLPQENETPPAPAAAEPPSEEIVEAKAPAPTPAPAAQFSPALLDPSRFAAIQAPDRFRIRFETTEGPFLVEVHRDWAPLGADRLYGLVTAGFYDGTSFFRVVDGFVAQWGIHPAPAVSQVWRTATIQDDPVVASNRRGTLVFASAGPNSRTTQLFLNLADNTQLDSMGFPPMGEVVSGMDVVDALYKGYGEGVPRGRGPNQAKIQMEGQEYLEAKFPELDRIVRAVVE